MPRNAADGRPRPGNVSAETAAPGQPLPGLTLDERARFDAGRAAFERSHEIGSGLGPVFNDTACNRCHNKRGVGGAGIQSARLVGFAQGQADKGAFMTVSRDYYDGGIETAKLVARVLRGESTAAIPFKLVTKITHTYNLAVAAQLGIRIPPGLLATADKIIR